MNLPDYFSKIQSDVDKAYSCAQEARARGLDPVSTVEIPQAKSLAERSVGLISALYPQVADRKIVDRILALEEEHGSLDPAVALKIAEELKYETGIRIITGNMGNAYISMKNYKMAEKYLMRALKIDLERKDSISLVTTYSSMSDLNRRKKDYKNGLRYGLLALGIAKRNGLTDDMQLAAQDVAEIGRAHV